MVSWLSIGMVVGGMAIVAAQRNWMGSVHICWVWTGAMLCRVVHCFEELEEVQEGGVCIFKEYGYQMWGDWDESCHAGGMLVVQLKEGVCGASIVNHGVSGCSPYLYIFKGQWWDSYNGEIAWVWGFTHEGNGGTSC